MNGEVGRGKKWVLKREGGSTERVRRRDRG